MKRFNGEEGCNGCENYTMKKANPGIIIMRVGSTHSALGCFFCSYLHLLCTRNMLIFNLLAVLSRPCLANISSSTKLFSIRFDLIQPLKFRVNSIESERAGCHWAHKVSFIERAVAFDGVWYQNFSFDKWHFR